MQKRWNGKSEGATIEFEVVGLNIKLKVFATYSHTLFGAQTIDTLKIVDGIMFNSEFLNGLMVSRATAFPAEAKELIAKIQVGNVEKMSKSKKNSYPNFIIEKYGANTARLFVLSDIPPEKEWSYDGVEGCPRYVNKLWRMVMQLRPVNIHYNNESITGGLLEYRKKIKNSYTNLQMTWKTAD